MSNYGCSLKRDENKEASWRGRVRDEAVYLKIQRGGALKTMSDREGEPEWRQSSGFITAAKVRVGRSRSKKE